MSVTPGAEATAPALAGRVGVVRRFSQGGCPGLIYLHAAGVQNVQTPRCSIPALCACRSVPPQPWFQRRTNEDMRLCWTEPVSFVG